MMTSGFRHLIFFVLIIGLAYAAYAYMIKPANAHLSQERTTMEQKRAKLGELERATAAAEDLSGQLQKVEEAIAVFESKLPPSSEIHTVLENVTLIAQRHGLTPKTIRTMKTVENRGYIEQPIMMELHGDFNSYYAFLLELEQLDRITKVRELKLKKKSQIEGQTESEFVMSIFFQKTAA
jgi:type IV pilus assembly protein PilO